MNLKPAHLSQLEHEWDRKSVEWDLAPDSVVVEIGAYKGRWAEIMSDMYRCKLYAFEPQRWAYEIARQKLDRFHNAYVFNCALGDISGDFEMGEYETDGCSFVRVGQRVGGTGRMHEITDAFDRLGIVRVDVMMVNVEGYEYRLIPYMAGAGMMAQIKNIMVQFHPETTDETTHNAAIAMLDGLYSKLWDYGDVLMAWGTK